MPSDINLLQLSSFKLLTHQNNFIENSIILPYLKIIHDDGTQK